MADEKQSETQNVYRTYEEFRQKFYQSDAKSSNEWPTNSRESASFGKQLARDILAEK